MLKSKLNFKFASLSVFISLVCSSSSIAAPAPKKVIPPAPQTYYYDEPSLLSAQTHDDLYSALSSEDRQTGNQVLVAIFNSLDNEDLVDYTNRLYQAWKIGEKQKSNGVLLSIFLQERKVRIEVGYGLEGQLTDAKSNRIIGTILAPAFKQKSYDEGVTSAVKAILSTIDPSAHPDRNATMPPEQAQEKAPRAGMVLLFAIIILMVLRNLFRGGTTIGRSGFDSGGLWGGGGGGFGGGGGGFSGGGGSSGGGGASGSW